MIAWIYVGLLYSKSEVIYLLKKVFIVIINRKTTDILNISCRHKYHQQRYHENTKIRMSIQYMYVEILFHLTKVIPIMFQHVTKHYQTLQTRIGHNGTS